MSNAEALRTLAQDMAQAQEERTRGIADMRRETAKLLRDMEKRSKKRRSEVSSLLKGFDKEHQAMSTELNAELAKVRPEIAAAEAERKNLTEAEIRERKSDVSKMLQGFAKEDMERAAEISTLLKGFDKEHQAMSTELNAELAKVRPEIAAAEAERERQAEVEIKERKSEVSSLLDGFRRDSAETAAAWRELVATMQAKRGGVAVAPPPVIEPPVAEPVAEEAPQEKLGLEGTIVSLIRDCAVGMKLTEIAEAVGEARIKVGNITRMLVEEGKISKEGLLYFPV